jgi:hypothetical protein
MMTLGQARTLLPGAQVIGNPSVAFTRVHTDTRTLRTGDLFVALKGERFDAHDFLDAARVSGAVAALASHGIAEAGLSGLQVDDPLLALQTLATAWRARQLLPLIAVTGSNGKTTVTQMVAAILRAAHGEAALGTEGNLNNHIGVPITVLRLRTHHRARSASWRPSPSRPSAWSTTPSASTRSSCTAWRPWRARTAASSARCRPTARPSSRPTKSSRPCGVSWPVRATC